MAKWRICVTHTVYEMIDVEAPFLHDAKKIAAAEAERKELIDFEVREDLSEQIRPGCP